MKKATRFVAFLLTVVMACSLVVVSASATTKKYWEVKTGLKHYLTDGSYFIYDIKSFSNELEKGDDYGFENDGADESYFYSDKALVITGFSENFAEEFVIPAEIRDIGEKFYKVVLTRNNHLKRVVLSDEIMYFAYCNPRGQKKLIKSNIKSLHLGREFRAANYLYEKDEYVMENLETITVSEKNSQYSTENGILKGETIFGELYIYNPPRNPLFEGDFNNLNMTRVEYRTFVKSRNFKKFDIGAIKGIGIEAFINAKLPKSLKIPKTVKSIHSGAFANTGIKEIVFEGTPKIIAWDFAANNPKLKKIKFEGNLKKLLNNNKKLFYKYNKNTKFIVRNKVAAKRLKAHIIKANQDVKLKKARIYVGKKLIFRIK